jgi:glycosyltransferase involved in cell wall biosynthesis
MLKKSIQWLKIQYNHLVGQINLTKFLKQLFTKVAPFGSRQHKFFHVVLRNYLKSFRRLNIRYHHWIHHHDSLSDVELEQFKAKADKFLNKPLLSIILPVFNPELEAFDQAIQSIIRQVYPHWELCISDDASTQPGVREIIEKHAQADKRIKVVYRQVNGHISAASNSAIALASGDYLVLFDHDDELHPLALFLVAKVINDHPDVEIIFSDEDKLTSSGKRIEPYFKSDFDDALVLSQNMVSHLGVYRAKTVHQIGGFRVGYEGSQDYDLLLRVIERIRPNQIVHIPWVLYHWRISKESVAASVDVKPYAVQAAEKAIAEHLQNQKINATVKPHQKFGYQIDYALPKTHPSVNIFIQLNQIQDRFSSLIDSMLRHTAYDNYQITFLCNKKIGTDFQSISDKIAPHVDHEIFIPENDTTSLNQCINSSKSDYICLVDEICLRFSENWLQKLLSIAAQPGTGSVSPQVLYKNGYIFSNGIVFGASGLVNHLFNGISEAAPDYYFGWVQLNKQFSALPHHCLVFRKSDFTDVGGFELSLSNQVTKTIDFCLKLQKRGLGNLLVPEVKHWLRTAKGDYNDKANQDLIIAEKDIEYFQKKWHSILQSDPHFNPNLTLFHGKPMVTKHPRKRIPEL